MRGLSAGIIEILYGLIILLSVWLAQQNFGGRFRPAPPEAVGPEAKLTGIEVGVGER